MTKKLDPARSVPIAADRLAELRDAARAMLAVLHRIAGDLQAIKDHDATLNGDAHGNGSRPPNGDDYNEIFDHALDAFNAIAPVIAQARAAGITTEE
jgi:hypothetical protein